MIKLISLLYQMFSHLVRYDNLMKIIIEVKVVQEGEYQEDQGYHS